VPSTIVIENMEVWRSWEGIDAAELSKEIRRLKGDDLVRLPLLAACQPFAGQTLPVRITRIQGRAFCGKLAARPTLNRRSKLSAGFPLRFATIHIHSIAITIHDHQSEAFITCRFGAPG
jgi:hypothetical protein